MATLQVQVFLPTAPSDSIKTALLDALLTHTHYYHAHIPLWLFLTPEFMQYVRNGKLILSLTKDTYEQLGLTGQPSKFYPDRHRYVVEVDLRGPAMLPGKPGFERIKWCFQNTLTTVFPMVLASVDAQGNSLPLEFPESTRATKMSYTIQSTQLDNIMIPETTTIRTIGKNDLRWRKNVSDLFEWIGMAAIQSER
ncbi:hypothetical protein EDD11_004475 [Mortierella claussenii]|nr:hypothetical protein EDD11_004475 [Mortierella claussenii]